MDAELVKPPVSRAAWSGHRLQLGPGRRPSDRSIMWHRKAWWTGVSSGSLATAYTCPKSETVR